MNPFSIRTPGTGLRLATLALALAGSIQAASAQQAFGQPDPDFTGSLRANAPLILPGSEVELAGSGFKPGQQVTLSSGQAALNAQPYVADAEGKFSAKLAIPADAVAGVHPIVVRAQSPEAASVFELKVSRQLPLSGQERFKIRSEKLVPGLYQSAYSAASRAVYVTSAVGRPPVSQSELLKVDPKSLKILARVTPAQAPEPVGKPGPAKAASVYAVYGVAVDDANGNVWVTNTRQDTVAVYRQSDLGLVRQFPVGTVPHPRDVAVDAEHGRAYVSAVGEDFLAAFDTATLQPLAPVKIASGKRGQSFSAASLSLDPQAGKLYTVSLATAEAAVVDVATGTVDKVFPLRNAKSAIGVAWDPDHKHLLVAAQGSDNLLIVDPASGQTLHDVYVGAGALNVVYDPASKLAFVSNRAAGTVAAVDAEGRLVANLAGGTFPNHASDDGKGTVFAVNKSRGSDDPEGDRITRIEAKGH